ncbi:MAG: hypothetical protein ACI82S_003226 [Patiriisocius sp.]|jgi:hypothetical protein
MGLFYGVDRQENGSYSRSGSRFVVVKSFGDTLELKGFLAV